MAVYQSADLSLTHRHRGQAPSHISCVVCQLELVVLRRSVILK